MQKGKRGTTGSEDWSSFITLGDSLDTLSVSTVLGRDHDGRRVRGSLTLSYVPTTGCVSRPRGTVLSQLEGPRVGSFTEENISVSLNQDRLTWSRDVSGCIGMYIVSSTSSFASSSNSSSSFPGSLPLPSLFLSSPHFRNLRLDVPTTYGTVLVADSRKEGRTVCLHGTPCHPHSSLLYDNYLRVDKVRREELNDGHFS